MFHHSMNYASAVIHGTATPVADEGQKRHGLRVLVEHLAPGSWERARQPSRKELAATTVLALPLAEASVKARCGPPADDAGDVAAGSAWAGVLPVAASWGAPQPCPQLPAGTPTPGRVAAR